MLPTLTSPGPLSPFLLADGSGPARWQTALTADWDAERLRLRFECEDEDAWGSFTRRDWWAEIELPWRSLAPEGPLPAVWRVNFYRIERPFGGAAEYSCWSPTLTEPADFHRAERFGRLVMDFSAAAQYVLAKNELLYRRLA